MSKVLFLEPLWPHEKMWGIYNEGAGLNTFAYGLAFLAASVRAAGHKVSTLNPVAEKMGKDELVSWLRMHHFDLVALPCYTPSANWVFNTVKLVKGVLKGTKVVIGGPHATILPDATMRECPEADFVLTGEAEKSLVGLLDTLDSPDGYKNVLGLWYRSADGALCHNKAGAPEENLDSFSAPAFDLFPTRNYDAAPHFIKKLPTFSLVASRGCPFKCAFCAASNIAGKKLRYHAPKRMADLMQELFSKFNARGFIFYDSTLTINKRWVYEFCEELIRRNFTFPWVANTRVDTIDKEMMRLMKRAGCWCLNMGLESANQSSLDLIQKGTTVGQNKEIAMLAMKIGFKVMATYIIALPGETRREVKNTVDFARQLKTHIAFFFLPVPYPKTRLFNLCMDDGGLRKDLSWDDFTTTAFEDMVYINPNFSKEELLSSHQAAFKSYYRDFNIILRNLKALKTLDQVKQYISILRVLRKFLIPGMGKRYQKNPVSRRLITCNLNDLRLNSNEG